MTTNFPSSADAFTNPTSGDTLDNPPHDQQHADINDAMEAVQTSLLDGAPLHIDDANERVGIGTTTPSTALDVEGAIEGHSITTSSDAVLNLKAPYSQLQLTDTDDSTYMHYSYSGGKLIHRYNAYTNNVVFTIDGVNQRVGIGTDTPAANLQVTSQNRAFSVLDSGVSNNAEVGFTTLSGDAPAFGAVSGYDVQIKTGTSRAGLATRLHVDSSGNVGINDTTPSYTLDVNGDINATGDVRVAGNPVGMVLLNTQTISGTPSSVDITGFSSSYRNYRLVFSNMRANVGVTLRMRFGTNSSLYYGAYRYIVYTGTESTVGTNNGSSMPILNLNTNIENSCSMDINNIGLNERTQCHGTAQGGDTTGFFGYFHANATAFTSVRIFVSGATLTNGTVRLYGYGE
jgi:hypothetical protein